MNREIIRIAREIIRRADTDNDGRISKEEFLRAFQEYQNTNGIKTRGQNKQPQYEGWLGDRARVYEVWLGDPEHLSQTSFQVQKRLSGAGTFDLSNSWYKSAYLIEMAAFASCAVLSGSDMSKLISCTTTSSVFLLYVCYRYPYLSDTEQRLDVAGHVFTIAALRVGIDLAA